MEIKAPKEFRDATRNVTMDTMEWAESVDMLGLGVLNGVDRQEGSVIRDFLDEILAANHDDEVLKQFWMSMPADVYFHKGEDVRKLLKAMRGHLDRPPYTNE